MQERSDLIERMREARRRSRLSYAALGEKAAVDPSQVSRICRGEFVTFSGSVVRICTALGLPLRSAGGGSAPAPRPGAEAAPDGEAWARLERSVLRAWDKTPAGADRLAKVIAAVANLIKR